MWSCNPTPGKIAGKHENSNSKRYMYPNIHSSTIYNNWDMEAKYLSTWIKIWYPCTMEHYSAINKEIMSLARTWMGPDITILSEVSQDKYQLISHKCRIQKIAQMNLFTNINRFRYRMATKGERGERKGWFRSMGLTDTYYMYIDKHLLYNTGNYIQYL